MKTELVIDKNITCEILLIGTNKCLKCYNYNGYYRIENEEYNCSNIPPADNYVLDMEAKEWPRCNKRCKKCYVQSRLESEHQCLECNQFYYPFKIDYENYNDKKITGFNCFTYDEVNSKYLNYFLNRNNRFEKCDISCEKCSEENNKCITCNHNYYNIFGKEIEKCFHPPLPNYGLIYVNNQLVFKPCFYLCKYCNIITQSFLYQQCNECDEINYTLDLFSLNQSYCIPKDNSNSSFIREKSKWFIGNFTDRSELEVNYKNLRIDYEKLLYWKSLNN